MSAAVWDVTIEQGVAFNRTLIYKDSAGNAVNISLWKFTWAFKKYHEETVYHAVFDTLSLGGLTVHPGIDGQLNFVIPGDATTLITLSRGVHELKGEPGDPHLSIRLAEGMFYLRKKVV